MSDLFLVFVRYYFIILSIVAVGFIVIFIADGRTRSRQGRSIRAKVLVPSSNLYGKTKFEDISIRNLFLNAAKLGARISEDFDNQYVVFDFDSEQSARNFVDIVKKSLMLPAVKQTNGQWKEVVWYTDGVAHHDFQCSECGRLCSEPDGVCPYCNAKMEVTE